MSELIDAMLAAIGAADELERLESLDVCSEITLRQAKMELDFRERMLVEEIAESLRRRDKERS